MSQIEDVIFQALRGAARALPPRAFGLRTYSLPTETQIDSCVRACGRLISGGDLAGGQVFIGSSQSARAAVAGVQVLASEAASAAATDARNKPHSGGKRVLLIYLNARSTPGESGLDVLDEVSASDLARGFAGEAKLTLLKQIAESGSRRVIARLDDASVELLDRYQTVARKHRVEAFALPLLGLLPLAKTKGMPPGALAADEFDNLQGARPENKLKEARDRLKGLLLEEREQLGQKIRPHLLEDVADPVGVATRLCEEAHKVASGRARPSEKLCGLTVELARLFRRGKEGIDNLLGPEVGDGGGVGTIPPPAGDAVSPWDLLEESGEAGLAGDIFVHEPPGVRGNEPPAFSLAAGTGGALQLRSESPPGLLLSLLDTQGLSAYIDNGCAALVEVTAGDAREVFTMQTPAGATIHWRDTLETERVGALTATRQAAVQRFRQARRELCEKALRALKVDASEEANYGVLAEDSVPDLRRLLFLLDDQALVAAKRLAPECQAYVDAYVALVDAAFPCEVNMGAEKQTEQTLGSWLTNLDVAFSIRAGRVDAARLLPLHPLRIAYALCALACGSPPPPFPARLGVNFMRLDWLEPTGTAHLYAFVGSQSPNAAGIAVAAREGLSAAWHVVRPTGLMTALRIAFVDVDDNSLLAALEELCGQAQALFEEDSSVRDGVHLEVWRARSARLGEGPAHNDSPRRLLGRAASECEALPRGEGVSLHLHWMIVQADSVPECHLVVRAVETPYETVAAVPPGPPTLPMRYQPGSSGNIASVEVADSPILRCYDRLLDALGLNPKRRGPNPSYPAGGAPRTLVEARVAFAGWPIEPHRAPNLLSYLETRGHVVAVLADAELADPMLIRRLRQVAPGMAPDVGALRRASLGLFSCRGFLQRLIESGYDQRHLLGQLGLLRAFLATIEGAETRSLALSLDSPEGRAWVTAVSQPGMPKRRADLLLLEAPSVEPGAPNLSDIAKIRIVELKARRTAPAEGGWEDLAAQALQTLTSLRQCFGSEAAPAAALQRLAWMEAGRQHRATAWQDALRSLEVRVANGRPPDFGVECWIILEEPWHGKVEAELQCAVLDEAGQPAATGERVAVRFRVLAPLPSTVVETSAALPAIETPPAGARPAPPPGSRRSAGASSPLGQPSSKDLVTLPDLVPASGEIKSNQNRTPPESELPGNLVTVSSSGPAAGALDGMRLVLGALTRGGTPAVWLPNRTDLVNHFNVGITGTMGTGKTQLTKSLLAQLIWEGSRNPGGRGPGILVFDYKGDYQDSVTEPFASRVGATVLQPEGLPLNPLRTIRPTTKQEFVALARVFADTMLAIQPRIGAVQRNEIVTAVTECFEAAGISASSPSSWARPFPTLKDLQSHLESRGLAQGTPQGVLMDLVALGIFAEEDPPGEVDSLFNGVHVVNLKPLGSMPTVIRAVLCFFMNAFYGHMLRAGEAPLNRPEGSAHHLRALRRLVFVDEADDFISLGLHSLKNVMQQGRSFGCGVVLSTQFLHYFNRGDDPLRPLIGTWVLHQMSDLNPSDVKALFGLSKADADQLVGRLSSLPKHTSLCVGLSSEAGRALVVGQPVEVRDLPFKELRGSEDFVR